MAARLMVSLGTNNSPWLSNFATRVNGLHALGIQYLGLERVARPLNGFMNRHRRPENEHKVAAVRYTTLLFRMRAILITNPVNVSPLLH